MQILSLKADIEKVVAFATTFFDLSFIGVELFGNILFF